MEYYELKLDNVDNINQYYDYLIDKAVNESNKQRLLIMKELRLYRLEIINNIIGQFNKYGMNDDNLFDIIDKIISTCHDEIFEMLFVEGGKDWSYVETTELNKMLEGKKYRYRVMSKCILDYLSTFCDKMNFGDKLKFRRMAKGIDTCIEIVRK